MKRIFIFLLTVCLMIPAFFVPTLTTAYAAGNNVVILFQGTEQTSGEVKIDVNVRENSGVCAMSLTLDYDTSALVLTNIEYGAAFQSLERESSGDYSTSPYRIIYEGGQNDISTGKMMTLTFAVKDNTPDGEYTVTFGYEKNTDVTYLSGGEIKTKNLIIGAAKITLKNSGVENVTTDETPEPSEEPNGNAVGWIIGGSVVGAGLITVIVILIVKKKKHKWIKV